MEFKKQKINNCDFSFLWLQLAYIGDYVKW
uniref:Uncharacterized protein n=1 Tax=Lotus japonicus TaxID=34305 RepID=I3SFB9_LOTJA|nr:unknown [Lotus japonicus]